MPNIPFDCPTILKGGGGKKQPSLGGYYYCETLIIIIIVRMHAGWDLNKRAPTQEALLSHSFHLSQVYQVGKPM